MSSNRAGAAGGGAIYGLGIFGAFVYYWQQADSLWEYVFSFIQGLFGRRSWSMRSSPHWAARCAVPLVVVVCGAPPRCAPARRPRRRTADAEPQDRETGAFVETLAHRSQTPLSIRSRRGRSTRLHPLAAEREQELVLRNEETVEPPNTSQPDCGASPEIHSFGCDPSKAE